MNDLRQRFLILGAVLFLFGLVSGLLTGLMANPRMGLSAHLQGITNGVFLLAVGAAWDRVALSPRLSGVTFWLLASGTILNWAATSLAAFWGTGELTPIISPHPTAAPWQEAVVSTGLIALTLAMLAGSALLLYGFVRRRGRSERA